MIHLLFKHPLTYSGYILTDMDSYYRKNFGSERHKQGQIINARVNLAALGKLPAFFKAKNILDVGCGYGFLLYQIKKHYGLICKGVELSKQEADFAVRELSLDVSSCSLAETNLPKESFDVITCFEVIEHILSPIEFVAEMQQYLKPGGMMIIMTDNFESYAAKLLGAEFPKWIPHSHISHFSPNTLQACIESVKGLSVSGWLSYTPWELSALAIRSAFRERKSPDECFNLSETLNSEMDQTYRLFTLRRIINRFWFDVSFGRNPDGALMYAVVRKK